MEILVEEDAIFYDQIVGVQIKYDGNEPVQVSFVASVCGRSADDAAVSLPVHELEFQMEPGATKLLDAHLETSNHGLSDLFAEFTAVAVSPHAKRARQKYMSSLETEAQPLFDFVRVPEHAELPVRARAVSEGAKAPPSTTTTAAAPSTELGTEVARKVVRRPLVACITTGIYYVRPGLDKDSIMCQFDLTVMDAEVQLATLEFILPQGTATAVVPVAFPLTIAARSLFAFTYKLESFIGSMRKVQVRLEYECNGKRMSTLWQASINFAEAAGPLPKTPINPNNHRSSVHSLTSYSSQAAIYPSSAATSTRSSSLAGVQVHLSGPSTVKLGEEFEWRIMVINKSSRVRKLMLRLFGKDQAPGALARHEERALVSDPFTLRKRVQTYRTAIGSSLGIIPLVPDIRIGQLGAYACFETSVRFLAAERGMHSVSGSSVHDFTSGETFDTDELLQMLVE